MKKYTLDLSSYEVTIQTHERNKETDAIEIVTKQEVYPIRENYATWLRMSGIWKDGIELCDAHDLAKQVKNYKEDSFEIDETELELLKKALNKLITIDSTKGMQALGGEIHEEAIARVFKAPEIK